MKTLNDLLGTLTPEEREMHSDLIDECIDRETEFRESSTKIRHDLERLEDVTQKMMMDIEKLYTVSSSLRDACLRASDNLMSYSLALIPDENFFHA